MLYEGKGKGYGRYNQNILRNLALWWENQVFLVEMSGKFTSIVAVFCPFRALVLKQNLQYNAVSMHLGQDNLVVRVEIAIFGCNNKDVEQGKSWGGYPLMFADKPIIQ